MNLKTIIDQGLQSEYSDQLLWEDFARLTTKQDAPSVLQRAAEVFQRELYMGWVKEIVPGVSNGVGLGLGTNLFTTTGVFDKETLYDIITVSSALFSPTELAKPSLAYAALAKAHRLGLKSVILGVINRNTQDWGWFKVTGDGKTAEDYLIRVSTEQSPPNVQCSVIPDPGMRVKLETFLESLNSEKSTRETYVFHPSELSTSQCDRSLAYGLKGVEAREFIEPKLRRIFDTGHVYHDLIQSTLRNNISGFIPEVKAKDKKLKISGHCDGVINQTKRVGVEIKSINFNGFNDLKKAKPEHEAQATIYGVTLELEEVHYIYACKETGNTKVFPTQINRAAWHKMARRAENILSCVNEGMLPPQINKDYICKACKYAWICKPELTATQKTRMFRR